MDLFGDLPEPDNTKSKSVTATAEETRGVKRKSLDDTVVEDDIKKKSTESVATTPSEQAYFLLKGYVAGRQGEREDMQDAHVILDDFLMQAPGLHKSIYRLALYAVFDGHGGARASRFASQHLHNTLRDRFPKGDVVQVEKEIKKIFIETFKKTDEDFLKEAARNKPSWKDGTTAVVVLAINDTLFIANLGDSKAILCRYKETEGKCIGVPLTVDHSPSMYEERMRIQKAGSVVRDGRVMGILEVSRSIGDGPYKNHGVTCVPDVKRCQLTDNDRHIVIACDGLWKSYTIEESLQFVEKILKDTPAVSNAKKTVEDIKYETVCNKLASAAVLRLSGDNVTVVVVRISKRSYST